MNNPFSPFQRKRGPSFFGAVKAVWVPAFSGMTIGALPVPAATPALKSVEISLPDDESAFTGPDADLLNGNCTGCHSASMVLHQPRMDAAHWAESVKKMRDVYKAPIQDADAARLAEALARVQAR